MVLCQQRVQLLLRTTKRSERASTPSCAVHTSQGNHGVSAGRGILALIRMLSGCAAAQSSSWASPADSATPEGISRGMAWRSLSFRLLERGCGTLDVLAVTAKHVLSSTGSVAAGQATPAPPEQLCEHTHCP